MELDKQTILEECRSWLGTRWRAGQSKKGVSCDCVGLVTGVCRNFGWDVHVENYKQIPEGDSLVWEFRSRLKEKHPEDRDLGDVLLFRLGSKKHPGHVGFLSENNHIIHSDQRKHIRKVIEVPIGYWEHRITHCFKLDIK
jgi:NlpC/P60 family putative phage cell wall peptidase